MHALFRTLFRLLLLVVGAVLGLVALAVGLLLTAGVVTWALLRGRKPVRVQAFRWQGMSPPGRAPAGEVVDIEAHEVREPAARVLGER